MRKILCQNNKYFCSENRRKLSSVLGVVIHYTGGKNDLAVNVGNYFKNNHSRFAGAHIVIDYHGKCHNYTNVKSERKLHKTQSKEAEHRCRRTAYK